MILVYSTRTTYCPARGLSNKGIIDTLGQYVLHRYNSGSTDIQLELTLLYSTLAQHLTVFDCNNPSFNEAYQIA